MNGPSSGVPITQDLQQGSGDRRRCCSGRAVDTKGLPLMVMATAPDLHDYAAAKKVLFQLPRPHPQDHARPGRLSQRREQPSSPTRRGEYGGPCGEFRGAGIDRLPFPALLEGRARRAGQLRDLAVLHEHDRIHHQEPTE